MVFRFKEFAVNQNKTAMKIGTDAVLLGSWCSLNHNPDSILDVGSGTGIISLMMAQRSDAMTIDAVEIESNAYQQTVENFEQSDWSDRLFCYHSSFENFAEEMHNENESYDLIISNPPFYNDAFQTENQARNQARFTSSLSFENLLNGAAKLLSNNGFFAVIIPFKEEENFIQLAENNTMYPSRVCRVKGNKDTLYKRTLLEFSFLKTVTENQELVIETSRHQYTPEYTVLTKDFYLKM